MIFITFLSPPVRRPVALFAALLALPWQIQPAFAQAGAVPAIKVAVKEGEGALNNIRTLRAKEPVVLVTDIADKPVAGAQVTFLVPDLGASGMFGTSGNTLTVTTGHDGIATGRGLKPNNVVGQFQIRVVASFQGQTARAAINQTNAAPGKSGGNGKTVLIVALLGGAGAAVAAGVLLGGGKSTPTASGGSSTAPGTGGISISPGGSTFGPPK